MSSGQTAPQREEEMVGLYPIISHQDQQLLFYLQPAQDAGDAGVQMHHGMFSHFLNSPVEAADSLLPENQNHL